jgi:methionyl-tRNA formyltransferase
MHPSIRKKRLKVVFFGTPEFAAETLRYLIKKDVEVCAVITKPDKPKGRSNKPLPPPVKEAALELLPSIPIYQPAVVSAPEFAPVLRELHADLFVVVAYGEILKQHILDIPRLGCINLHASLLPKYRGAAPIQRCIIHGETESGVTIIYMDRKMDTGDMIKIKKVPVGADTTYGELMDTLLRVGSEALEEVIRDMENDHFPRIVQDHSKATLAPKLELEDCELKWDQPASALHNLVRGTNPFPGAWTKITIKGEVRRLKVRRTSTLKDYQGTPGDIAAYGEDKLIVACGEGALSLEEIQLEGKKAMTPSEFMRGMARSEICFG